MNTIDWSPVIKWLEDNRGRVVGALLGLVGGLFFIWFGFLRGLFLIICVAVGYFLGGRSDARESLNALINRLLPPGD